MHGLQIHDRINNRIYNTQPIQTFNKMANETLLLQRILEKVTRLEKLLAKEEDAPKWVKLSTLTKVLGVGGEWARHQRRNNEFLARKKASGQYEYNLTAYKKLAA